MVTAGVIVPGAPWIRQWWYLVLLFSCFLFIILPKNLKNYTFILEGHYHSSMCCMASGKNKGRALSLNSHRTPYLFAVPASFVYLEGATNGYCGEPGAGTAKRWGVQGQVTANDHAPSPTYKMKLLSWSCISCMTLRSRLNLWVSSMILAYVFNDFSICL